MVLNQIILNLPWQIQVSLASGYAAYLLAYMGIRSSHRSIDITFVTLVFSVIASGMLWLLRDQNPIIAGGAAIAATALTAVLWRRFFRGWLYFVLRSLKVTWSNDDPSALATIIHSTRHPITQVAVELDDGRWLRCDHADRFSDTPFGPVTIGPDGDVALYLTHEDLSDGTSRELQSVRHDEFGDRITYVPANRIRQITVRHLNSR